MVMLTKEERRESDAAKRRHHQEWEYELFWVDHVRPEPDPPPDPMVRYCEEYRD